MQPDEAAQTVECLYETWYSRLLGYTAGLVPQLSSAEEIVQDTFFDLYKALRVGQKVEYPKAWTMCVARRKASQRLGEEFGSDQPHEAIESAEPVGEWADEVEAAIDCERVRHQLHVLSRREYEVLMLRLEPMKYRQIAASLGISINTVNVLLARALEKLQRVNGIEPATRTARRAK